MEPAALLSHIKLAVTLIIVPTIHLFFYTSWVLAVQGTGTGTDSKGPRSKAGYVPTQKHSMALLRMIIIRQIFIFLCNVETMAEINKPHDQGRTHQSALTMPLIGTRQVALQRSFSLLHSLAHDPHAMHILSAAMLPSRSPMASSLLQSTERPLALLLPPPNTPSGL